MREIIVARRKLKWCRFANVQFFYFVSFSRISFVYRINIILVVSLLPRRPALVPPAVPAVHDGLSQRPQRLLRGGRGGWRGGREGQGGGGPPGHPGDGVAPQEARQPLGAVLVLRNIRICGLINFSCGRFEVAD